MESLGGLNDVSEKDEMKEEKVVNLDEEKKKRKGLTGTSWEKKSGKVLRQLTGMESQTVLSN